MIFYKPPFPYGYVQLIDLNDVPKLFKPVLAALLQETPSVRPKAREVIEMLLPTSILGGVLSERRVTFLEKITNRSTKHLVSRLTGESNEAISLKLIEKLVYKGIKKPFKIIKFVECLEEKNIENIFSCIKSLHVLHIYMYKVPLLLENHKENTEKILINIMFT